MSERTRVLLTGGGTAGHVNPALAIGRTLAGEHTRLLYVGVRGRAEAAVVPREGLPIRFVRASGYPGARPSPAFLRFLVDVGVGTLQAAFILLSFRPEVIVGTGGYASAPVMFAAAALRRLRLCGARVFVHEQNAAPGKLNLLVGRLADRVFVTFPETVLAFPGNAVLSGYPLRRRIAAIDPAEARSRLDFDVPPGRRVIFVFGGSQGARTINRAIVDALRTLLPHRDRVFVIHGTGLERPGYHGARDVEARLEALYDADERRQIETFYVHRPYFHQIEQVYAVSDLVVARGGAGSLYELASLGLPAIVIPKANLPGDHQVMNARAMARVGGAKVLYEETMVGGSGELVEQVDGNLLAATILELVNDDGRRAEMGCRSRGFLQQDALTIIERVIAGDPAGSAALPEVDPHGQVPGNRALLSRLEKAATRAGCEYTPDLVVLNEDDRAYFVSRAASLLAHPRWEERNLGVKLLGLLHARERVPLLVALLRDRRPAPLLQRMMGGDYRQVGFIRRNTLAALARLGVVTTEVEAALIDAFGDPYYEARAEAARTAAALSNRLIDRAAVVRGLAGLLDDRWLEVAVSAAEALGYVGGREDALPALLAMRDARFWVVRAAALRGLVSLVERGEGGDPEALVDGIREFVLSSTDFTPEFQIKRLYARLLDAIENREGEGR